MMNGPKTPIALPEDAAGANGAMRASHWGVLLLVVVLGGAFVHHAVVHPARNYLLDFRGYYAAGAAMHAGVNPYDTATIRERIRLPGEQIICRYVYPPPTLGLMYGVATLPYPGVQVVWCMMHFTMGLGGVLLLLRALRCEIGSVASLLVLVPFALSPAFSELFLWGQFDMIVVALLCAAMAASIRARSALAGVLLGLAAAAKVTPLLFLCAFAVRRDWRALAAGVATIVALMAVSCALLGADAVAHWLVNLREFGTEPQGNISAENMSLLGFATRAFVAGASFQGPSTPWWDLGPAAATWAYRAVCVALLLPTFGWIARHRARISTADAIAALVPVALLISPRMWTHHTVALIVPVSVLALAVVTSRFTRRIDVIGLGAVLLLFTVSPVLQYGLALPSALAHLLTPVPTYAALAAWLMVIVRLVPLRTGSAAVRNRRPIPASHFASVSSLSASASAT